MRLELPSNFPTWRIVSRCRARRRQNQMRAAYYRKLLAESDPQLFLDPFGRVHRGPAVRFGRYMRRLWK